MYVTAVEARQNDRHYRYTASSSDKNGNMIIRENMLFSPMRCPKWIRIWTKGETLLFSTSCWSWKNVAPPFLVGVPNVDPWWSVISRHVAGMEMTSTVEYITKRHSVWMHFLNGNTLFNIRFCRFSTHNTIKQEIPQIVGDVRNAMPVFQKWKAPILFWWQWLKSASDRRHTTQHGRYGHDDTAALQAVKLYRVDPSLTKGRMLANTPSFNRAGKFCPCDDDRPNLAEFTRSKREQTVK